MSALALIPLAPAVVALLLAFGTRSRAVGLFLAPWVALPALVVASIGAVEPQRVPWLLLGTELEMDPLGRAFLLFTAVVWTASGVFARSYVTEERRRVGYFLFHCLTLAGNLALIVAADVVTFYLGFAVMTFAAYGLVVYEGSPASRRAGRVYLAMSVLAEGALIAALLLAVAAADGDVTLSAMPAAIAATPARDLIVGLLLVGFGVKAGVLPLHVWLPLAHPVAPTPASAVLSGCMIKAGLLGWLRFLPLGEVALGGWGAGLVATGFAAAVLAALAGAAQDDPKTALAYSSISQMGLMIVAVGIGLGAPAAAGAAVATSAAYAAHHALAKGALFLGVGVAGASGGKRMRRLVLLGLSLPALALAGAPLSSGMIAKNRLKDLEAFMPAMPVSLDTLLPIAAVGTTLVLARFVVLVAVSPAPTHRRGPQVALWLPAAALIVAGIAVGLFGAGSLGVTAAPEHPVTPSALLTSSAPIVLGLLIAWLATLVRVRVRIPPGDVLVLLESEIDGWASRVAARRALGSERVDERPASRWYGIYTDEPVADPLLRWELWLTRWEMAALLLVVFAGALFSVAWLGSP